MTIIPEGDPAWARTSDHTTYGGHLEKANYLGRKGIDALTDVNAEQFVRLADHMACVSRTVPLLTATVGCDDHGPGAPLFGARLDPDDLSKQIITGCAVSSLGGSRNASFVGNAPPTGMPSGARNGTGDVTITLPTTWTDPFGVEYPVKICHAFANVINSGDARAVAVPEFVSDNVVRIRCFAGNNSSLANACFCLTLY